MDFENRQIRRSVVVGHAHSRYTPLGLTDEVATNDATGDMIVIPAGVSHCNVGQSKDFRVVGGYPAGQQWDMMYGKEGERPAVDETIKQVSRVIADPAFGPTGPLMRFWGKSAA